MRSALPNTPDPSTMAKVSTCHPLWRLTEVDFDPGGRRARPERDLGRAGPVVEGHCGPRMTLESLLEDEARQCRQAHEAEHARAFGLGRWPVSLHRGRLAFQPPSSPSSPACTECRCSWRMPSARSAEL